MGEYRLLTKEEKATILEEFEEHKVTEAKALHQSNKSRVSDVSYTVRALEDEVSRTFGCTNLGVLNIVRTAHEPQLTDWSGSTSFCYARHN